jgi:glutamate-1-semialdehyde 2,1-aminomutase
MKRRNVAVASAAAALLALGFPKAKRRLELSRAKHPGLTGHAKMAKRVAGMIPFYDYDEDKFFTADDPSPDWPICAARGFRRLSETFQTRFAKTIAETKRAREGPVRPAIHLHLPGPFQFSRLVREHLPSGTFLQRSHGREGHRPRRQRFYDLTGSYGVNLFGYDFYKETIAQGSAMAAELGRSSGCSTRSSPTMSSG